MDFTVKKSQKNKMVKENGLENLVTLEERMRAIEGTNLYDPIKATKMCLVSNVVIPKKFRVPEFIKYIGTQCPITHLKTYCNKMVEVIYDKKLLIHFFQNSLNDATLTWYMWVDNTKVKKVEGFIDAFNRQFKLITDMTSDRLSL
jgi:hypothetical protein